MPEQGEAMQARKDTHSTCIVFKVCRSLISVKLSLHNQNVEGSSIFDNSTGPQPACLTSLMFRDYYVTTSLMFHDYFEL